MGSSSRCRCSRLPSLGPGRPFWSPFLPPRPPAPLAPARPARRALQHHLCRHVLQHLRRAPLPQPRAPRARAPAPRPAPVRRAPAPAPAAADLAAADRDAAPALLPSQTRQAGELAGDRLGHAGTEQGSTTGDREGGHPTRTASERREAVSGIDHRVRGRGSGSAVGVDPLGAVPLGLVLRPCVPRCSPSPERSARGPGRWGKGCRSCTSPCGPVRPRPGSPSPVMMGCPGRKRIRVAAVVIQRADLRLGIVDRGVDGLHPLRQRLRSASAIAASRAAWAARSAWEPLVLRRLGCVYSCPQTGRTSDRMHSARHHGSQAGLPRAWRTRASRW